MKSDLMEKEIDRGKEGNEMMGGLYIYGERDSISSVPMRIEPFRHPSSRLSAV